MKRHQDKMSDSPTCKQQKTAKEEEAPNSLLSLPKEILHCCVAFVGKGHYRFVGSVCKKINKIYENAHNDNKKTIWKHVAVSEDLAKMCMRDHKDLGRRRHEIKKMVNAIGLVAATSGNVQVFKWALWNNFYIEELWRQYDVFHKSQTMDT